jgi:hypothetical protein
MAGHRSREVKTPAHATDENRVSTQTEQTVQTAHAAVAQATQAAESASSGLFQFPDHWPAQGDLFAWCQQMGPGLAALLVLLGVVYLLFGYNIFKILVVLNAATAGAMLGVSLGDKAGAVLPLAITGAFIAGVAAMPLMKWAVAFMGGLCGALLGASLWRTFNLDPSFAWAGAGMGLIFFGLLTFILFRGCVMTFMSLQGAVMLVFGVFGLIFKYHEVSPAVARFFAVKPFLLPMVILIPTVLGVVFQQNNAAPAGPPPKK